MNCDQAFDAMTDPNGPDSPELWRHLKGCPRCRQMYETLEPALGLFAAVDANPAAPSSAIGVRSGASPLRLAQRIARQLSITGPASRGDRPRRRLWGAILAAAVAGFLLSVGLDSMHLSPQPPGMAADCPWLHRENVSSDETARSMSARCVACHLSQPGEGTPDQAGVTIFRQDWDRFLLAWQARIGSPAIEPWLISADPPGGALRGRGIRCRTVGFAGRAARPV